jgi:hypothetical protein
MSATSLAVMSAVPMSKAGLASGTQTMARNIGTAMGVALFGAIFLNHVDRELPARLADLPPEQSAPITAAAEHFVPAGEGEARLAAEEVIVDGFIAIALVTVFIAALATGAAYFIRHRSEPLPRPLPAPTRGAGSPGLGEVEHSVVAGRVAGNGSFGDG